MRVDFNLIGDIDEAMYERFTEFIGEARNHEITIKLTSHGGDAMVALAFYDRIKEHKKGVNIIARGIVASAAVIILAAGTRRYMSENAWVMIHEDVSLVDKNDRVTRAETQVKISRLLETQWNKILAATTKMSASFWGRLHEDEAWLDPDTCLEYGLIDKII